MTPQHLYGRLNKLLWFGRLPDATVILVDNETMPKLWGIVMNRDENFALPIVVLNYFRPGGWEKTLIHECLHIAEPELRHGKIFDSIVEAYHRRAKKEIKGYGKG